MRHYINTESIWNKFQLPVYLVYFIIIIIIIKFIMGGKKNVFTTLIMECSFFVKLSIAF